MNSIFLFVYNNSYKVYHIKTFIVKNDKNNVRESFTEYKKTLEQNLMNISYLYNGDVVSSNDSKYSEIKNSPLTSPSFIINTIVNIYNESFDIMTRRCKEFTIPKESLDIKKIYNTTKGKTILSKQGNLLEKISDFGIKAHCIFCSDKGKKLFGVTNSPSTTSAFPAYFYSIDRYPVAGFDLFYSPLIKEDDDEIILYIVDKSIQSLVYSIQNMDYKIEANDEDNQQWKHTMDYSLYDCRFNSYKLSIKNVSRLRNDKINKILNGN